MGLLDDAIREHLELRRRHGADPGEIARQEQEALGRVRRGEAPAEEGGAVAAGLGTDTVPAEPPVEEPELAVEELEPRGEPVSEPEPSEPAGEPEAPVAPPAPADERAERAAGEVLDLEPPPAPEVPPEPPAELEGEEAPPRSAPRAPDAERPAPDDAGAGEDVLEETPEFLQETPEHDRLWFEQKPPRDFEF
jgi:hypothetical protein